MASQQRLTSLVRRFLGVMRVLILIGIVFVPLITLAVGYGALEESDDPDARVFAELRVIADVDAADAERPRTNALVRGWAEVRTRNREPLLQFGAGSLVLANIDLVDTGIQLNPSFNLSIAGLFVGFATIVLAGILREAVVLREEQQLTI